MNHSVAQLRRRDTCIEGAFLPHETNIVGRYRVCKIAGCEVRVWGASQGSSLSKELIGALRPILKLYNPPLPVALMPDHHPAEFGVVGSVIASTDWIAPELIGADTGCGVHAHPLGYVRSSLSLKQAQAWYRMMLQRVPVGSGQHKEIAPEVHLLEFWAALESSPLLKSKDIRRLRHQFGSLGGGNHFIELAYSEVSSQLWVLVHSGSRFLGGILKSAYRETRLELGTGEADSYLQLQQAALRYAAQSREKIALIAAAGIEELLGPTGPVQETTIDIPHNFVALEEHQGRLMAIHRKGSCAAMPGQVGIVPGSMGVGSVLTLGRGNPASYSSCSHGAGRVHSRARAFREISNEEFRRALEHIVWANDPRLKDEAPQAYKDIDQVMQAQKELVRSIEELKTIASVKGVQ